VVLHRERPGGDNLHPIAPAVVPFRFNLCFFFLAFTCGAVVIPVTGDQDLLLSLNSPAAVSVATSARGGLAWDCVSFARALPFFPIFLVFGLLPSVTQLIGSSFGVP
jgi:hypothetical protein